MAFIPDNPLENSFLHAGDIYVLDMQRLLRNTNMLHQSAFGSKEPKTRLVSA